MTQRIYQYFLYTLIIFSGISYAFADSDTAFFDTEFTLKSGESIQVESGLGDIKFIKVLVDSRCPVNVTCVWAGNVRTELEIQGSDRKKTSISLNTRVKPNKVSLQGYTLKLISISPIKEKGVLISPEQYQVALRIKQRK